MNVTFQDVAPGLMIFATMILTTFTSGKLGAEIEQGTLQRFRLAKVGSWQLLLGTSLAQFVLASVSFAIMLGVAAFFGFTIVGSMFMAFCVILLTAVCAIGLGMFVSAFARNRDEAANLSLLLMLPLGFLSGAFFPIPALKVGGFNLYDAIATTHAANALNALASGAEGDAVVNDMIALAMLAALTFWVGALAYRLVAVRRASFPRA